VSYFYISVAVSCLAWIGRVERQRGSRGQILFIWRTVCLNVAAFFWLDLFDCFGLTCWFSFSDFFTFFGGEIGCLGFCFYRD